MPCSYEIDVSKEVVLVAATGLVTDADWISTLLSMARHKDFHPDLRGFSDYTGVTDNRITADTIIQLAQNPRSSPNSRWAFLVSPGYAGSTISFYRANLKFGQLEIFTDRAAALAWLNEGAQPAKMLT
jgi:hypothetical protein